MSSRSSGDSSRTDVSVVQSNSETVDGYHRLIPTCLLMMGLRVCASCIGGEPAVWLQDRRRSLDQVQQASGDLVLKRDRTGPRQLNLFMRGPGDHGRRRSRRSAAEGSDRRIIAPPFELVSLWIDSRSTTSFTPWGPGTRGLFHYIADARAKGLKRGYVEREGLRRYFDGFGSSSIEKRNMAQVRACRWLLQY